MRSFPKFSQLHRALLAAEDNGVVVNSFFIERNRTNMIFINWNNETGSGYIFDIPTNTIRKIYPDI